MKRKCCTKSLRDHETYKKEAMPSTYIALYFILGTILMTGYCIHIQTLLGDVGWGESTTQLLKSVLTPFGFVSYVLNIVAWPIPFVMLGTVLVIPKLRLALYEGIADQKAASAAFAKLNESQ